MKAEKRVEMMAAKRIASMVSLVAVKWVVRKVAHWAVKFSSTTVAKSVDFL